MTRRTKPANQPDTDDAYLRLIRRFPLRPIRSEADLDRAIAMADTLIDRNDLVPGEDDYLDVLGDLIHRYESDQHPIGPVSDAEMLRFLLDANDLAQADLARRSGIAESTVSDILAGRRHLSRRHIETLARTFRVSPAVFFQGAKETSSSRAATSTADG